MTGYELFGTEHFLIMLCCAICAVLLSVAYARNRENGGGRCIRLIVAVLPLLLIVIRQIYVICSDARIVYDLPLHLCSLTGMLCFVDGAFGGKLPHFITSLISQSLYALGLPGAVLAIVFSDGTMYPPIHFITIQSSLFHTLIIVYVVYSMIDGRAVRGIRYAYQSIVFLVCVVPPVYLFDRAFHANYMFLLGPSVGSPLTSVYSDHGYGAYLICFAGIVITDIMAMNLIPATFSGRHTCGKM